MHLTDLNLSKLFDGYQLTPQLWQGNSIMGMAQFPYDLNTRRPFKTIHNSKKLRLGKWVEEFVTFQLQQNEQVRLIGNSIQIRENKVTIGELDHIFCYKGQPIHMEVVYKFYLYDPNIKNNNPLASWIGPNKNDTLIYKLNKLKTKQLQLLYHVKTKSILEEYGIEIKSVKQYVQFKAKLFIPSNTNSYTQLNTNGIVGYYIRLNELERYSEHNFYIPEKLEWLIAPNLEVDWVSFDKAEEAIIKQLEDKRSPLVWLKTKTSNIQQFFVVWW